MNEELKPTKTQELIIREVTEYVNDELHSWGRQSGKTTLRQMIAKRILEDDE